MTDTPQTPAVIGEAAPLDAYALLSKPTKNMSDAEVLLVITELRKRRLTALTTGKPDRPVKEAKEKAKPLTKAEKERNARLLLAGDLDLTTLKLG